MLVVHVPIEPEIWDISAEWVLDGRCVRESWRSARREKKEKSERKKVNTIGVLSVREKKKRDDWRE